VITFLFTFVSINFP